MRGKSSQRRLAGGITALTLLLLAVTGAGAAAGSDTTWTVAGNGISGNTGDGGQAREAQIDRPRSIFSTADGGYMWAQPWSSRVRKVGPDGLISTIAGTGTAGFSGDGGSATAAQLNFVHAAVPTPDGGYLLADMLNHRIRKVSAGGVITTVAGNGTAGYGGDGGPATSASINTPRGVVSLSDGSFLIPDSSNHRVRKVSTSGIITTVAGTGVQGFAGDGGPAAAAQLSIPFGVAPTADGGYLIVDVGNQRIRKVSAAGVITTVVGTGVAGASGDGGPATAAQIYNPHNVVEQADGGFLIADTTNQRVRRVAPDGTISTLAGTGIAGYSGDGGPASAAQFAEPKAVGTTAAGNVLVADELNNRIRFVGTVVAPANTAVPQISGLPQQDQTLTATAGGWSGTGPTFTQQWRRCDSQGANCADIPGATARTYVVIGADVGSTLRVVVTASNSAGSSSATSAATAVVSSQPSSGTVTFSVLGGSDDGTLTSQSASSAGYPPTGVASVNTDGSFVTPGRRLVFGEYRVLVGLLRFDTSALPDGATVTGASLRLRVTGKADADNRGLVGEWYGAANWPIDAADYALDSSGSALAGADLTAVTVGAVNAFDLIGLGSVSTTGLTGLRLHVSGGQPAGDNYLQVASYENSLVEPQLVVSYSTGAPVAPSNTALPVVSGTPESGQTLTSSTGSWSGTAPITYAYQWRRCDTGGASCVNVGTNASSYLLTSADVGSTIRSVVTASNGAGSSSATSAATAVVSSQPSSGTLTFSVSAGGDDGDVWVEAPQSGGYPPAGTASFASAGSSLTVGRRAVFGNFEVLAGLLRFDTSALPDGATVTGASLRLRVTGKADADNRGLVGEWYGAANWPIDAADYALDSSGSALAGADLTAVTVGAVNAFDLIGLGSVSTTGLTGLRLHVSGGQPAGDNYLQVASYENSLVEPQLVVSYSTGAPVAPSNTALPVVSGTPESGQTLTSSTGSWSGTAPITYAYQWRRCDTGGASCVNVGTNASSYLLTSADVGSTIRSVVTASNGAGSSSATSAATAVVSSQPSSGTLTFSVSAGGDDGDVWVEAPQSGGYPPAGTASFASAGSSLTVGRRAVFGNFEVLAGLLRFDTSALPDGATVTGASLRLRVTGKADADNRGLVGEWYGAANWPIDAADYALDSSGSALAGADLTAVTVGAVNAFDLIGLGSVSTTGLTGLRLHVSGGQPAGDNYLQVASYENSLVEPQLVVSYSTGAPVAPSNTALPVVSGTPESGQTLTSSTGSWSGTAPITYAYQWRRCDTGGASCVNVGTNASSYLLTSADVGSTIRSVVTASNGAGSSSATSAATAVVSSQPSSGTLTFSVSAGGDDGDVWVEAPQSGGYPPAGTASFASAGSSLTVGRRAVFGNFEVLAGLLRFDTSALPDGATVTGASLRLRVTGKADADNRGLVGEWYGAANWPIDAADYALDSSGSALAGADLTAVTVGAVNAFDLIGLGSVSTTGLTGLRLHVSGGQPAGDNYLQVASYENSLVEPQLTVTYAVP